MSDFKSSRIGFQSRFRLFGLLFATLSATSCNLYQPEVVTIVLTIPDPPMADQLHADVHMEPLRRNVSGNGPEGATFCTVVEGDIVSIPGMAAGWWDIRIDFVMSGGEVVQTTESTVFCGPSPSKNGSVEIEILPEMDDPIDITMVGQAGQIVEGYSTTARVLPGSRIPRHHYSWYLDGEPVGEGRKITLSDLGLGYHSLGVLVAENGSGLRGSQSTTFEVVRPGHQEASQLDAGLYHTLALDRDGVCWAWGSNALGELGDGTAIDRYNPVPILTGCSSVSAGGGFSSAVKDGSDLYSWGINCWGQLGIGNNETSLVPTFVMADVHSISAGYAHTLVVKTDGSLWAFGYNRWGQLGDGTTVNRSSPVKVMDDVLFVSAGRGHSLAVKTDGSMWAWGSNGEGQLGDGTRKRKLSPVQIMSDVVAVDAGGNHTLILGSDGTVWTCGSNESGQLGDGEDEDQDEPVHVLDDAISVHAGHEHSIAMKTDGTSWTWGQNEDGQLGVGDRQTRRRPALCGSSAALGTAGRKHTGMIKLGEGGIWLWGNNKKGQLGIGTLWEELAPIEVSLP